MRVLVCGGRDFGHIPREIRRGTWEWSRAATRAQAERDLLTATLSGLVPMPRLVIHGAQHGADKLAEAWAKRNRVVTADYPANWYPTGRSGGLDKAAGPRRNARMIAEGKPDLVVAFPDNRGTADLVRRAKAAGIPVQEVCGRGET